MDHSELGEPLNGFRYKWLEPAEHKAVFNLLRSYLMPALEPIGYKDENWEDWEILFTRMVNRGTNLSYVAIDIETGEVAAARMCDSLEKDVVSDLNCAFPPHFKVKKNIDVVKVFGEMWKGTNIFEKFGESKIIHMFGLVTDPKFRQRGLAIQMYRRGLNAFQKRGYRIIKVDFISPYSRKAGQHNGFIEHSRLYFHDCKNEEGDVMNPESEPKHYVNTGYFDLKGREIQT